MAEENQLELHAEVFRAQVNFIDVNFNILRNLQILRDRRRRKRRQMWTKAWLGPERRRQFGLYDQLMVELRREDTAAFTNFMRMPPEMFDEMLVRVGPRITKLESNCRHPIHPGLKLAITLRHLASGAKYMDMRYGWRVPHNTISIIVREVCQAIIEEYADELMPLPTSADDWQAIADGFLKRWNFPHTLGAIDGKHVACKCPPRSGSLYFNYKKYFSIILLALVDSDYKFIWADIGGRGAASDAQLWNQSDMKVAIEADDLDLPPPAPLPYDLQDAPYFIIGDDAFALKTSMQKPYTLRGLNREERTFNYRLSRARRVVENAFGILANRFQVLLSTMEHRPETVRVIVTACCLLHNLMRTRYPRMQNQLVDQEDRNHDVVLGEWRRGRQMDDCHVVQGHNIDNREGKKLRNLIKHWVNSDAGSVAWQNNMI